MNCVYILEIEMFAIDFSLSTRSTFLPPYLLAFIKLVARWRRSAAAETSSFEPQWNGRAKHLKALGNQVIMSRGFQEYDQKGQ